MHASKEIASDLKKIQLSLTLGLCSLLVIFREILSNGIVAGSGGNAHDFD